MTIAIQIDAETERLARKMAEASGKPLPQVVKEAIEASAAAAGVGAELPHQDDGSREARLMRLKQIAKVFDSLPVLDARPADEIIGYDANGVPK